MALLGENSWCCVGSQLDLFTTPPVMITHEESIAAEISSLVDNADGENPSPLHFSINTPHYIDLSATKLYLRGKLLKQNGSATKADTKLAPTNMFLHSLIRNVDVLVGNNQQKIMECNDLYPYKAAIETMLNYGTDAKNSMLQSLMFYKDTAGSMDSVTDGNAGLIQRNLCSHTSKEFEVFGPLHVGLFFQEKYLLSGTKVDFYINRTSPSFYLSANAGAEKFMFKLSEAKLHVRYVDVSSSVSLAHESALAASNAKYAYNHIEIRKIPITANSVQFDSINLFSKRIPKKLLLYLWKRRQCKEIMPQILSIFNISIFKTSN